MACGLIAGIYSMLFAPKPEIISPPTPDVGTNYYVDMPPEDYTDNGRYEW